MRRLVLVACATAACGHHEPVIVNASVASYGMHPSFRVPVYQHCISMRQEGVEEGASPRMSADMRDALAHTEHVRAIALAPACDGGTVTRLVLDDWRNASKVLWVVGQWITGSDYRGEIDAVADGTAPTNVSPTEPRRIEPCTVTAEHDGYTVYRCPSCVPSGGYAIVGKGTGVYPWRTRDARGYDQAAFEAFRRSALGPPGPDTGFSASGLGLGCRSGRVSPAVFYGSESSVAGLVESLSAWLVAHDSAEEIDLVWFPGEVQED